jgi:glucosamine-6-phosphate deaminase
MEVCICSNKSLTGQLAAEHGANVIQSVLRRKGECNVVLATGASQFEMLSHLAMLDYVDWSKVTCFHLDEYIGLQQDHPASFVKWISE